MMNKKYSCALCHEVFTMAANIGQWQCRVHIDSSRTIAGSDVYYACCGLSANDVRTAEDTHGVFLDRDTQRGCVRADHAPATRTVSDLHIMRKLDETAGVVVPNGAIVKQFSVDYGQLMDPKTTMFEITFPVPGSGPETRDIRALVKALFDEKLGDDEFWQSTRELIRQRTKLLLYKTSLHGTGSIDPKHKELFGYASRSLPDLDFLKACVITMRPVNVKLPVLVVRAAAPAQDPSFVSKLADQRAYVKE